MKRITLILVLVLGVLFAGVSSRAQAFTCFGQCQDASAIFAAGCVQGGGSESVCTQLAYQYLLDCYVDCVVP